MKTRILAALALAGALLFLGQAAHAQTQTNVTATVVDPLGIPYANGTYSIQLIPTGTNPSVNGQSIGGAFNGTTDATGSFNVSLWPNASIVPAATTWQFTVCTNPGGVAPPLGTGNQCTPPTAVTIAGASQSLSATLSAVAPRLTLIGSGGGGFITGAIAANQVAFGSGANTITGSNNFTYTAGVLNVQTSPCPLTSVLTVTFCGNQTDPFGVGTGDAGPVEIIQTSTTPPNGCGLVMSNSNSTGNTGTSRAINTCFDQTTDGGFAMAQDLPAGATGALSFSGSTLNQGSMQIGTNEADGVAVEFGTGPVAGFLSAADVGVFLDNGGHFCFIPVGSLGSGFACIGTQNAAGTPNPIEIPTATGVAGTFLETDGGNPQHLSWTAVGGGAVTGTAGQTLYVSGVNAATGTSVTRDMLGEAGADLGAKMANCATNLPAAGGTCKGDNLPAQTLSTAVTTAKKVTYTFCGQAISQTTGTLTLNAANSAIEGCPDKATTITKAGNIDQITLSAANVSVRGITLAGVKASFTGNGIVTAAGATQAVIENNVISGEAGDAIKDNSGTFSVNLIRNNILTNWGLHGYEGTATSQQSIFSGNYMVGDGTATGTGILNAGSARIIGNYLKWTDNSQILFDDSTAAQQHVVTGNSIQNTGTATAFKFGLNTTATGNTISQSGGTNPAVSGQGIFDGNIVNSTGADAVDIVSGTSEVVGNTISAGLTGVSNMCAINSKGDQIGVVVANNRIQVGDNAADTNYAMCDTPTGGHNLNILFSGNRIDTTLGGGAVVDGFFLNNAAGLNTNWSVTVQDMSCLHLNKCLKRVDAQNNLSLYRNIQIGDTAFDEGTGSTKDVIVMDNLSFAFATLPTPIGNASRFYCTDCSQTKPTAALGAGAWIVREAGANNGL